MKKNKQPAPKGKSKTHYQSSRSPDEEKSVGSPNAFEATERPQKDSERELSDEELDDLIDDDN